MLMSNYFNFSWWFIRTIGFLLIPTLFYDIEVFFLFFNLLYFHMMSGLKSVFLDYIHELFVFEFFSLFLRILNLELVILLLDFLL